MINNLERVVQPSENRAVTPAQFMEGRFGTRFHIHEPLLGVLEDYSAMNDISTNIAFGVYNYVRTWRIQNRELLGPILYFMDDLRTFAKGPDFFKSRSFNYLSDDADKDTVRKQATENARYMTDLLGPEFFATVDTKHRATVFKAPIGNSDYYLSAKGGSGAGTFSLDLAIGIDKGYGINNTSGELWRTGIDTELNPDGDRVVRIIRTGSGVKHDPPKMEQFDKFRKRYKIMPQRALALLTLYIAHSMGAQDIKALSTIGAKQLSTLARGKEPFDYTELFEGIGFKDSDNPNWLAVPDLQTSFYSTLETTPTQRNGLRSFEVGGLDVIVDAFQHLVNIQGERFPAPLTFGQSPEEIEHVLVTFGNIHNW